MVSQEHQQPSTPARQPRDSVKEARSECVTNIPESWKLTQQQQAFIGSFAEDEQQKQ